MKVNLLLKRISKYLTAKINQYHELKLKDIGSISKREEGM